MIEIRMNGQSIRPSGYRRALGFLLVALAVATLWLAWSGAQPVGAEPPWPEPPTGTRTQLPILTSVGNEAATQTVIQVQNIGSTFTKAIILAWGEAGACTPQAVGPFKVECSGLIKPGATWMFGDGQLPAGAQSAIVYTFSAADVVVDGQNETIADAFCERLFANVRLDADEYRRFDLAFREGRDFFGLPTTGGQPVAIDVVRVGQGTPSPDLTVAGAYAGITGPEEGAFDPVFGGFSYYAPIVYGDAGGLTSYLYIQNSGLDSTGVELWFQEQNECLRAQIVEILCVAPGETAVYNVSDAVGPSFVGSVWIRTSQPAGVIVDHIGQDVMMTDKGVAAPNADLQSGSEVLFGPLIYREFQGWETAISVQNLSGSQYGAVKVYFYDESGNIITTLVDYICPRATQTFFLPVINGLPGQYVGAVRVESLTVFKNAGADGPRVPIAGVAHLRKYTDPASSQIQEAISYNLFGEAQSFDWQIGPGQAGLIGVPSVLKQGRGLSTELAIQNVNPNPGFTDFAIYIYDPNGLLEVVCEKLSAYNVEYINFNSWGILNPGFVGSVVISGVYTNQPGGYGLTAVAIQRVQSILQFNPPGDEASGHEAIPIFTENFDFEGFPPQCPGQPPGPCTFTLFGSVIDQDTLLPINGAAIWIDGSLATTTNSNGNYFVDVVAETPHLIQVTATGYGPAGTVIDRVECGGILAIDFELTADECTITISGQVIDRQTLLPVNGASISIGGVEQATTDSTGRYSFQYTKANAAEDITIVASRAGYADEPITLTGVECDNQMANFELDPLVATVTVAGSVEDKITGEPIANANVLAFNCVGSGLATTGADGAYLIVLDFDPTCTTKVIASAVGYNPSADSVSIPIGDTAIIDFQLHRTPTSRVLLYYGNGGVGPDDAVGPEMDYFTLQTFYESLGFIVDYTDEFPTSADWISTYKLVVLLGPGHDSGEDLIIDGFTIGQKAWLDQFLQQGGHLVILSDHSGFTGQAVENDLLDALPVDLRFNSNSFADGLGDQIAPDCLTDNVGVLDADQWTDVTSPGGTAVPGALVLQNASADPATNCPNCAIMMSDVPSHGAGRITIVGDLNFGDDATALSGFNWSANNEDVLFNFLACDF